MITKIHTKTQKKKKASENDEENSRIRIESLTE